MRPPVSAISSIEGTVFVLEFLNPCFDLLFGFALQDIDSLGALDAGEA